MHIRCGASPEDGPRRIRNSTLWSTSERLDAHLQHQEKTMSDQRDNLGGSRLRWHTRPPHGGVRASDGGLCRLIDALKALEVLDDTLIDVIIGDNGASAEGTLNGLRAPACLR
jgi:arylsulfatase A-like enzyme